MDDDLKILVDDKTIKGHAIGYDGSAFTLPVFEDRDRCLVSGVKRRFWPSPGQNGEWKRGSGGSRARLYPDLPSGGTWLLCEGELDALIARQKISRPVYQAYTGEQMRTHVRFDNEAAETLSDDRIVALLTADGVNIARRTVAKYREAMRIPSSVERRRMKVPEAGMAAAR